MWKNWILDPKLIKQTPFATARDHSALPIAIQDNKKLLVAHNRGNPNEIKSALSEYYPHYQIELINAEKTDILENIYKYYKYASSFLDINYNEDFSAEEFIDLLFVYALDMSATDIHLEPNDSFVNIRLRIDGILHTLSSIIPYSSFSKIQTRLKVLANLNIAENRMPQSGSFKVNVGHIPLDIRLSTHPVQHSESIAIRILPQESGIKSLFDLGFLEAHIEMINEFIAQSHGMIIICGATGSGKSTSLASMISAIDCATKKVMTLEDPIEYNLSGVLQTDLSKYENLSFGEGIRSLLRQDIDVMLIGEMRDQDTANMAIRASLTGHLILTTLHSGSIDLVGPRLMDLDVDYSSAKQQIVGIIHQKLIRKICSVCYKKDPHCDHCLGSGYKGRTVVASIESYLGKTSRLSSKEHIQYYLENNITDITEIERVCGKDRFVR